MAETNAETDGTEQVQLAGELADARRRIAELEALAAERSHAQEESRQDQRLYRELFEDSLGLMCVHDLDGVLLIVNPAAAQSLGFRPEEGVGVNMKRFLAPAVRPLFDAYLDRIRRNRSDSGLLRLVARDGGERIWLYRNVLYEEPGTPPRVLGHAQDISERVRAEEALKESERRFRSMADTAPVFIWMSGTEGQCEFVSKAWLDFSGRTLEQELGRGWTEGLHPEVRERGLADFARAIAGRENFRAEYRMRRADGEYRWILNTGTPRFNSAGQFAGHIGSCLDVTEARQDREALRIARDELAIRVAERTAELLQANEALRQSEQHYQVLTNLAPVGIFRTDAAGRCLYINEQACQICGIGPEEAGQGRWDRILEPDLAQRVDSIQMREEHWVIADLLGKAGHIHTGPIPGWVKAAVDEWKDARTRVTGRYPDHRALPWMQAEAALRGQPSDWHLARRCQVISKRRGYRPPLGDKRVSIAGISIGAPPPPQSDMPTTRSDGTPIQCPPTGPSQSVYQARHQPIAVARSQQIGRASCRVGVFN